MKTRKILFVLTLLFAFTSCRFGSLYEGVVDIEKANWERTQVAKFDIPVNDTIHRYDILVTLRNNNDYPYSNLYLFITTISPAGKLKKDTLELTLADEKGKWLGKGLVGLWSTEHLFQPNIRFPQSGTYRIEVEQGMRNESLEGIRDIGLRIVKNQN